MLMVRRHLMITALVLIVLFGLQAAVSAQGLPNEWTRFTISGAPTLAQPKEDFSLNVGNGFGAGGALLYRLDRPGILHLRFDASFLEYGREKKRVPFSSTVGARVLVDEVTTNSIIGLSFGPELALPSGPVRPYVNAAFSGLFFRTTSSVNGGLSNGEAIASTTNYSDATHAWIFGSGVRIPVAGTRSRVSLDFGVRYHRGALASYLREGSIQDNPNGTISFTPLSSRTPYLVYLIGVHYRIPHNPSTRCPRFLC